MDEAIRKIRQYVLAPDPRGLHLRTMVDKLAEQEMARRPEPYPLSAAVREACVQGAAETIAAYIVLVWGGAGPDVYALRTYEILRGLQDRMRGMDPDSTWGYAVTTYIADICPRLRRAESLATQPAKEAELIGHFFDALDEYEYLHDVARNVMQLHWGRRHDPDAPDAEERRRVGTAGGQRGDPAVEEHLRRAAIEGLATYILQANIARGYIEEPTDPRIVLSDRIDIQRRLGGKNAETWEGSGWEIADRVDRRYGSREGRRRARLARGGWKAISRDRPAD